MPRIAGLPAAIAEVPEGPNGPSDPLAPSKRALWLAWARDIKQYRVERRIELHQHPELIPYELEKCRRDGLYWLAVWGTIYEPREREYGTGVLPFIPFAKQAELWREFDWLLTQRGDKADAVWSKCRGWGASWLLCAWVLWRWRFTEPFIALMVSRTFEYVDSKNQKSLFWKIEFMRNRQPDWMLPRGFREDEHDNKGIHLNPENGNQIGGEATTGEIGRGDRATIVIPDEGAFIPGLKGVWSTIQHTADHRLVVSTESLVEGSDFHDLQTGDDEGNHPHVMTADWWENPLLDDAWYRIEWARAEAEGSTDAFEREVLRNVRAGVSTFVYPQAWDKDVEPALVPERGRETYVTWDPGFADDTAIVICQVDPGTGGILVLDSYINNKLPADYYGQVISGQFDHEQFTFRDKEHQIAELMAKVSPARHVGDTYGNNTEGASGDSFYARLLKYGIVVYRDRRGKEDMSASQTADRTFQGRRLAVRDALPTMRFADTPGAKYVLRALREHRFADTDRPRMSEPKKHLHDWTSHPVSALEYLAVYLKMVGVVKKVGYDKPTKARLTPRSSYRTQEARRAALTAR